jgi:hypothetical protein
MYNHTGHYAAAGEAVCKALFMGGVTRRFSTLQCAFLEGGVGWAADLYAGLIARWEKRNPQALANYNPANLETESLMPLSGVTMVDLRQNLAGSLAGESFAD